MRYLRVLIALFILAPLAALAEPCSWNDPGADPYTGTVREAVMRYEDIPWPVRELLAHKLADPRKATDIVAITREFITGKHVYIDPRDMHFGQSRVCKRFDRTNWAAGHVERARVACAVGYCVARPDVCGNVFRLDLAKPIAGAASTAVPEPGSILLAGLALGALALTRRGRR